MRKILLLLVLSLTISYSADAKRPKQPKVNNIIYMIGDGMGLGHVSMMILEGKYAPTIFDASDNVALIRTNSANNRVTDSATSGTALACGYKTNNSTLGMTPDERNPGKSIVEAEAPVSEMYDYTISLRAMTQGRGSFAFRFIRYEEVPGNIAEKVIAEAAKNMSDDE